MITTISENAVVTTVAHAIARRLTSTKKKKIPQRNRNRTTGVGGGGGRRYTRFTMTAQP